MYQDVRSFRRVSANLKVGKSTVNRWWTKFQASFKTNRYQVRKKKTRSRRPKFSLLQEQLQALFTTSFVDKFSLRQFQGLLDTLAEKRPSLSWIRTSLRACSVSRRRFRISKTCPKTKEKTLEEYKSFWSLLKGFKDEEIMSIDETGFCSDGTFHYGYFNMGRTPEFAKTPRRLKKSLALAVLPSGAVHYQLQSDAFNKVSFSSFVKDLLKLVPGTVKAVIMDNVTFHRSSDALFTAQGIQVLRIPPYTPQANPIEEVFSLMKRTFRNNLGTEGFNEAVSKSIKDINSDRDFSCFFRHTRRFLASATGEL